MIPTVFAESYHSCFATGRTKPCVFTCVDSQGNLFGEYVVKLKGNIETGSAGLLREIIASCLAQFLGLPVPKPAIISVDPEIANIIPDPLIAESIRRSGGLNFGTQNISGGFVTWPVGKSIPNSLHQLALETFVFDMLIQNPDGRINKPNLLWKEDQVFFNRP